MLLGMDSVQINAKDFIDAARPVVDAASAIGVEAARVLRGGGCVVLTVQGVRGVSSSFFNVILSAVAPVLGNDFSEGRFEVVTDTNTQLMVYQRSLAAFTKPKSD